MGRFTRAEYLTLWEPAILPFRAAPTKCEILLQRHQWRPGEPSSLNRSRSRDTDLLDPAVERDQAQDKPLYTVRILRKHAFLSSCGRSMSGCRGHTARKLARRLLEAVERRHNAAQTALCTQYPKSDRNPAFRVRVPYRREPGPVHPQHQLARCRSPIRVQEDWRRSVVDRPAGGLWLRLPEVLAPNGSIGGSQPQ